MTRRSSHPCREREGPSSPRCFAEASDALQRRDYAALRSLARVAPVTKRSGKSCIVVRRQACHDRLANAVYHWARVAVQHDPCSRAKYAELRRRGHSHGSTLRSVADRLLNVACAMLKSGAAFNPSLWAARKPTVEDERIAAKSIDRGEALSVPDPIEELDRPQPLKNPLDKRWGVPSFPVTWRTADPLRAMVDLRRRSPYAAEARQLTIRRH
jgi:hypothetical protein